MKKIQKYDLLTTILAKYQKKLFNLKIDLKLKYILKIIYNFNKNKKTIWFLGFNSSNFINKTTLKYNKHLFLPKQFWVNGVIGNKRFIKSKSQVKKFKTPDLVIIFDSKLKLAEMITEFSKQNVPVIIIGSSPKLYLKTNYVEFICIKNFSENVKPFLFSIIYSIIKKY